MADEFVKAGLLDWSKDKLRIELTLRTTELIDLNLTLGNSWNIETPNKLFSDYVGRIEMNQNTILTDEKIINLPRKIQSTYLLWKRSGCDYGRCCFTGNTLCRCRWRSLGIAYR